MTSYALVHPNGTISELSVADTSFDEIRVTVGGFAELVRALDGSDISAYVDEEARLKRDVAQNPVASRILGRELLGPVVLVGAYDHKREVDTALTAEQWEHVNRIAKIHNA